MDQALYAAWKQRVQPDDVVICGGDVALAGSLDRERLARVQALPGRKLLVMGNHDLNRRGRPTPTGFDEASMTMLIEHDTPLLLTHVPLDEVPPGCVNIHGHVHNNVPLGHTRHINICVENTGYEPVRLEAIRMLADQLVAGWTPPGETTLERLHRGRSRMRAATTYKLASISPPHHGAARRPRNNNTAPTDHRASRTSARTTDGPREGKSGTG